MATRKQKKQKREQRSMPLLLLLLLLVPFHGGYYNFQVFICGVALLFLIAVEGCRKGIICIPTGVGAMALYGLCFFYFLSIPFAVSAGMALMGALRIGVWCLFFLYVSLYSAQERRKILVGLAWEGVILSALTSVTFLCASLFGKVDDNGRIDGLFQYANIWALYLLVCLTVFLLRERHKWQEWGGIMVLLSGIFLSGSRGVFLLLMALVSFWLLRNLIQKCNILYVLCAVGAVAAVFSLSNVLSGGLLLERMRAITISSSSLNGRLLYYLDGLQIIKDHPMGVGRGGYLYIQPLYQTGIYCIHFIHNEYLQAALDGGILAGICMGVLPVALALQKHVTVMEKTVIVLLGLHALIDFDYQYTCIAFLLLLCGAGGKVRRISISARTIKGVGSVMAVVLCYFSLVYAFDYAGCSNVAYAMYPADLSLAEEKLYHCDLQEREAITRKIIEKTDLSMLAWDCRYILNKAAMDGAGMAQAQYQYLRLNRYRAEVYRDFVRQLTALNAEGTDAEKQVYKKLAGLTIKQLEQTIETTSTLAYRIADKPDFRFSDAVIEALTKI